MRIWLYGRLHSERKSSYEKFSGDTNRWITGLVIIGVLAATTALGGLLYYSGVRFLRHWWVFLALPVGLPTALAIVMYVPWFLGKLVWHICDMLEPE